MNTDLTAFKWFQHRLHEIIFEANTQACPSCMAQDHDVDAVFCKKCAAKLNP